MSVTVELLAKHSSAKDHLVMTGWTLSADKLVRGDGGLVLQHVFFPVTVMGPESGADELRRLYSGVHSIEHALASPLGGDLRARLDEVSGQEGIGKRLIDMSPYVPGLVDAAHGELGIGFRATVVSDGELLARDVIATAYDRSLRVIRDLFAGGGAVPFSTPEECGQYDMHSADAAVELIDGASARSRLGAGGELVEVEVGARELCVCDLRLVKPRLPQAFDQRVLDVLGGHFISQAIEGEAWKYLADGQAGTVTAGNFGCSTGEYLMVGNPGGLGRDKLLRRAHVAVAKVLDDLAGYYGEDALQAAAAADARFALVQIERYGGRVWGEASGALSSD
jgi:S-ribosylhomocysteine lyase LuxS involved in autoinducer biosynthesis